MEKRQIFLDGKATLLVTMILINEEPVKSVTYKLK